MKTTKTITILSVVAMLAFTFLPAVPASAATSVTCPLLPQSGRTIINIDDASGLTLRSDRDNQKTKGPVAVSIPAGSYDVTLVSYDDHTHKQGQVQPNEQWKLILKNSGSDVVATTASISDLPSDQDWLTEKVNSDFSVAEDVSSATAFHDAYPSGNANSIFPICAAFDEKNTEQPGSIKVCKAIVDSNDNIVDGSENSGLFSISGINGQNAAGILPESQFQTPLNLNSDVFEDIGGNDAQCVLYDNLILGSYYYGEESITGDNWQAPLYNDQYSHQVTNIDDFFNYNFDGSNSNVDGEILLTKSRPHRELVVLNRYEEPTITECSDGIDNDNDGNIDYPNDTGCDSPNDDSENTPPVITLTGDDPFSVDIGNLFTDPGATADDAEDGNLTGDIVVGGDTVDTTTEGAFIITYDVTDSEGAAAPQVTRTVNVIAPNNSCPFNPEAGRIIADFPDGQKILDGGSGGPISVNISAGTYKVTLASFDGYHDRKNANQPQEIWKAVLKSGSTEVAESDVTTDLRDDIDFVKRVDVVNQTLVVNQDVDSVFAVHGAPQSAPTANSVEPVCAAFDPVPSVPQCSDGIDNDNDGNTDYPSDTGCDGPNDDSENTPPVITLTGDDPVNVIIGASYVDDGATADDAEDGDLTGDIVVGGDTVDTNTIGTYVITYNVVDFEGAAAVQVTRTIIVSDVAPECSDDVDNDGDQLIDADDPGCHTDGDPENPDSYDPNDNGENTPPVITISGDNPLEVLLGGTFTDPGATAEDAEDGDLTHDIIVNGDTVITNTEGSYNVVYHVTDSGGLTDEKTRVVNVVPFTPTACNDGVDNDGDSLIDIRDNTCHTDNDENNPESYDPNIDDENGAPTITLIGDADFSIVIGNDFTDDGATAFDVEDGDLTGDIVVGGDTVDTNTIGTYVVTYDVTDSGGLSAPQVTRTVNVISGGGGCTSNCGGGLPPLEITNEAVTVPSSGVAVVTWKTNIPATSQTVYDDDSHDTPTSAPDYGYESMTSETTGITTSHRVEITGLTPGIPYYFRPVSKAPNVPRGIGDEVTFVIPGVPPIVPPGGPTQCTYLKDFLRIDFNNNPEEVTKLQTFLRDFEGFSDLAVTGIFDQPTFTAVEAFQEKYRTTVLDPWSLPDPTGYVYLTTRKKVNEIFCNQEFPLTAEQSTEIANFKASIEELRAQPNVPPEEVKGLEGQVGVAPATGAGGTLAAGNGNNVLEGANAPGALGITPEANENIQKGGRVATLLGTVGTSGVLATLNKNGLISETGTGTGTPKTGFLAAAITTLTPSTGRGITIAGIILLLAYLILARAYKKKDSGLNIRRELPEIAPDVEDEGEGTILEV